MGHIKDWWDASVRDSKYKIKCPYYTGKVVDAEGGIGYIPYFGIHFANDGGEENKNLLIDPDLRAFIIKPVKRHEEIFTWYGDPFWSK